MCHGDPSAGARVPVSLVGAYRNLDLLAQRVLEFFSVIPKEFERLKEVEDEINHFKNVMVSLKDISDLEAKVESVRQYEDSDAVERELKGRLERGEIDLEEYTEAIKRTARTVKEARVEYDRKRLIIRHVANHYYIPLILSGENERIEYMKHIIQENSEVRFVNRLEEYLANSENNLKDLDWWMFSELDESLDDVYLPYYDGRSNRMREFKPDFIFWMQKGKDYAIAFIDPKGTEHTDYQRKIDGYSAIFEKPDKSKRPLVHNGKRVCVFTFLCAADKDGLPENYKEYWFDDVGDLMDRIVGAIAVESATGKRAVSVTPKASKHMPRRSKRR